MKIRRAIYFVMLVLSVLGVGYAALWLSLSVTDRSASVTLSKIASMSDARSYSPETAQYFLVAGFGLLFVATLVGAIAVIGLLRQNRS